MRIGIVLPTLPTREHLLERTLQAYEATRPAGVELSVEIPEGFASVGEAWNSATDALDADYVFFAIDDAAPREGWLQPAVDAVDAGFIPSPELYHPDGSVEARGSMGFGQLLTGDVADWTPCRSGGLIFTTPSDYQAIGEFLPIHYSVDDDWHWRAACAGVRTVYREGFAFTHHHDRALSRRLINEFDAHREAFLENCRTAAPLNLQGALDG